MKIGEIRAGFYSNCNGKPLWGVKRSVGCFYLQFDHSCTHLFSIGSPIIRTVFHSFFPLDSSTNFYYYYKNFF